MASYVRQKTLHVAGASGVGASVGAGRSDSGGSEEGRSESRAAGRQRRLPHASHAAGPGRPRQGVLEGLQSATCPVSYPA